MFLFENSICFAKSNANLISFMIFMFSFFLFKFGTKRKNSTAKEIEKKKRKAERYLGRYNKENEDFFLSEGNDIQD